MDSRQTPTVRAPHDPMRAVEGMRMYIDEYGSNDGISPLDINNLTAAYNGILLHTRGKLEHTMNWRRRYAEELYHLQIANFRRRKIFSQIKGKNSTLLKRKSLLKADLEKTQGELKKARELAGKLHRMVEKAEQELTGVSTKVHELEKDVGYLLEESTVLKEAINRKIKLRKEAEIRFDAARKKQKQERETTFYEDDSNMLSCSELLGHADAIDVAALLVADQGRASGEEKL